MLIPLNEHILFLAERWLKLLSDLGRAKATLTALPQCPQPLFSVLQPAQDRT